MVHLLIFADTPQENDQFRFGGWPNLPDPYNFTWPRCTDCEDEPLMQFLGQIPFQSAKPKLYVPLHFDTTIQLYKPL